jgi:paraquat-inducible protein A
LKLAAANLVFFLFGIFVPCLKITPHLGEGGSFDFIGHIAFGKEFAEKRLSIAQGILELMKGGDYFIGIVLFVFTLAFPAYKMYLTFFYHRTYHEKKETYDRILKISKYSMLDIFVLGLIVLSIKVIPGGTTATIQWGAFFFFANIFLTKYILGQISKEIGKASD